MRDDWLITLEQRQVIHRETGLIFQFRPSLDGSGAMSVDTPNPEALPPATRPDAIIAMTQAAWSAYAQAAEIALGLQEK
ncbi:MAG: hypothetical protein HQM02_02770 [Magnetococcales bacterium]|nr:hypothetical protein [Magnetococcales bacterium]